jgi:hypothetical protein
MSAYGPKQTCPRAVHMSAFGGKADITFSGNTLSLSLLGVKRTCRFALHMSAFDPKRTLACTSLKPKLYWPTGQYPAAVRRA